MELSDIDLRKRKWSPEEDQKLMAYIEKYGIWNWSHMPKAAGLSRSGKSCRLRWMNYLRPELKRDGGFTKEEIETIIKMHESLGNKWSMIAAKLPGRSDNEIKNFWQKHARKYCKSNPTVPEENYYRPKRFKHKQKRVTEVKSSLSYGADESNLENSSTITESTQFPIAESYSPTKDYDVAFAASDILENVSSSETCGGIQGNLFSAQFCIEDVYLPEINSIIFEEASSTYPAHEWDVQEFPYSSNNDELTSFWINIFLEANHLFC